MSSLVAGLGVASAFLPNDMSHTVKVLKKRSEYLRIARARISNVTDGLVLQTCRNTAVPEDIKVGFTASKKIGNAVKRNRARRRLRAAVEKVMPLHATKGYEYVIIARNRTLKRSFGCLITDLETALKKLRVWSDK